VLVDAMDYEGFEAAALAMPGLERNAMRWNRMRFHLIAFARTGDACCRRHDGSS
jgi:hypothetical protein